MKRSISVTLLSLFLVVGCAEIEPVHFMGPNGGDAYSMRCSGLGRTLEACYQTAGQVCPNGYDIVSQDSSTIIVPVSGGFIGAPKRTLAIECNN